MNLNINTFNKGDYVAVPKEGFQVVGEVHGLKCFRAVEGVTLRAVYRVLASKQVEWIDAGKLPITQREVTDATNVITKEEEDRVNPTVPDQEVVERRKRSMEIIQAF